MSVSLTSRSPATDDGTERVRLAAVATTDPFDRGTFSGYSASLFGQMQAQGIEIVPFTSRQIRARDLLGGAVHLRGIVHGRFRGRRAPLVDPDWYWSAPVVERLSADVEDRIAADGAITHVLQIGTHVRIDRDDVVTACVTDCTVVQAIEAGEFAISKASPVGVRRAVEWQREVFASSDMIFTTSEWAAASVIRDYSQGRDRVVTIGAGANNIEATGPAIGGSAVPTVLFVGYDWDLKGGPLLLEAWRSVKARVPDARLVIVGCRPRIDEPGVEVIGALDPGDADDRSRLLQAYASASCLALVSDFDAFPNVILEAGAMGLPVVAFDEQSRNEVVRDRETGLLAIRHDAGSVARALQLLLANPSTAAAMGRLARARIESEFTWNVVASRVLTELGVAP